MARKSSSRSSGGGSRSSFSKPPAKKASSHPVHKTSSSSGSVLGGIGGAIADGFGWGAGVEVARRAVDAVFGHRTVMHETVPAKQPAATPAAMTASTADATACGGHNNALQDCLKNFGTDISRCQVYMDMLAECRGSSSSSGELLSA